MILPKFLIREIKENFGLALYTRKNHYAIGYICEVKNLSDQKIKATIIFPQPPNSKNQIIVTKPTFIPNTQIFGKDNQFENNFVYWKVEIQPKTTATAKVSFSIDITPIDIERREKVNLKPFKNDKSYRLYTRNEKHVNFKNEKLKKLTKKFNFKKTDVFHIAKELNDFTVKKLNYGNPIKDLYSSIEGLTLDKVDCGGFASLLCALLRYYQIPSRIVSGYLLSKSSSVMHAWVEFMLPEGTWVPADPTIENLQKYRGSKRSGKFGFVGSDHLILSHGSDLNLKIFGETRKVDILQNPIVINGTERANINVKYQLKVKLIN